MIFPFIYDYVTKMVRLVTYNFFHPLHLPKLFGVDYFSVCGSNMKRLERHLDTLIKQSTAEIKMLASRLSPIA